MTTTPDPETVREIARERIQAQGKYWNQSMLVEVLNENSRFADLDRFELLALRDAVIDAMVSATVTVSWPDEQPQDEHGPLRDEYGIRITYTSTLTEEGAVAETLGEARAVLDRLLAENRRDMVSAELIQRKAGEWRKIGDDRG